MNVRARVLAQIGERVISETREAVMYEVPLEHLLQRQILYDPEFAAHLVDWSELPRAEEGVIANIQDGSVSRTHPELSKKWSSSDPRRLGFAIYADDVEIANPIGAARGKHKVTLYYASILNVPPHVRSELDYMFLVAVVLSKEQAVAGVQRVIQGDTDDYCAGVMGTKMPNMALTIGVSLFAGKGSTFASSMHRFARPEGITFTVSNVGERSSSQVVPFRGFLILISADTLAAADLIGFSKGFTRNVKSPCWQCDCKGRDLTALDGFTLRTDEQYFEQKAIADGLPVSSSHARQTKNGSRAKAKNKGIVAKAKGVHPNIKRASVDKPLTRSQYMQSIGIRTFDHGFCNIPHFSAVRMVPRDLMHVELEGTLKSHLFGVLYMAMCKMKWFTREEFNSALRAWPFPKGSSRPDIMYDNPKGHTEHHRE